MPERSQHPSPFNFPALQTQEVEVVTLGFDPQPEGLRLFEFEFARLEPVGGQKSSSLLQTLFSKEQPPPTQWLVRRRQEQAWRWLEELTDDLWLEMVAIPAGKFMMGSPKHEPERSPAENPQHQVTIKSFLMARYQVTQTQWRCVAESLPAINRELDPNPSHSKGEKHPVEQVSWYDAVEFCDRLSSHTGRTYRLPSEAEWEYACRAGTTTPFYFGETLLPDLANYDRLKARATTKPVDSFVHVGNAFGLAQMHGNVWEWCADHWHDTYAGAPTDGSAWLSEDQNLGRVRRGGSWFNDPEDCRSAHRTHFPPDYGYFSLGFRVACTVPVLP
uniref:formylglycine-generating enzyme family protein n=1 Tax=Trichocoleus desertorum TaxID=1481672 RepID=UPI0025B59BF8|nr:formylglycine-generating enzyme family protein [Trichocoleus desertorum]